MSPPTLRSVEFRREREASWRDLDALVERAERRGVRTLSAAELSRLPGLYRGAVSSLSVARAISLDRNLVAWLDALCVRAYGVVYGVRRGFLAACRDLLWVRLPAVVRARRAALGLAALALVLGTVVGWATTDADPARFDAYVPASLSDDRGPHASTEELRTALYVREPAARRLAHFAAALFTHNARVGILSFVLGFLAGFPTALLLFQNGLILGAFASLHHGRGLGLELWAWLLPHGVPELSALVLCGGAGLLLAQGLLFPGRLSRREHLTRCGRDAGVLVAGAVVLLFVAGFVEGVVRQTVLDPTARLGVAAVLAAGLVAWMRGGRRAERAP